jgi:WS/DGAT/MGAT family acyltransferase
MLNSDAFAWYMEKDPVLRSTIVAINRLDRAPDWETLRYRVDRLTRLVPSLRMRVQQPPLRMGAPRWVIDESFDLDFHLRRIQLPPPAGWADVVEHARRAAMDDFDRSRALWEFTLIDGLADGSAAFVVKLHHALSDGIGGIQLVAHVVDLEPDALRPEMPDVPVAEHVSPGRYLAQTVRERARTAGKGARRGAAALPDGMRRFAEHPGQSLRGAATTTASIGRFVAPVNRQISPLLGERRTNRALVTLDVPFTELHGAARASGGHLNDAFLAALTDGMHRYHEKCGAPLQEVRVTVPVSIRNADDPIGGNRITLARIRMPAAVAEPAERIRLISEIMQRWRHEPALEHTQGIAFGLNLLPRPYLGGIFKRIEILASDVPGVATRVWLAGAEITGFYAFGPTIGSGINATLMSYAGMCNVGINVDTSAVDSPELLLACVREAFDEVLGLHPSEPAAAEPAEPAGV